ncbi:hypothetical protein AAZX31_09G119200 [Glycine max]
MVYLAVVPVGYSSASTTTFTSSPLGFEFLFLHRNTLTFCRKVRGTSTFSGLH